MSKLGLSALRRFAHIGYNDWEAEAELHWTPTMSNQLGENIAATVADEVGADKMEVDIFWLVLPIGPMGREFGPALGVRLYQDFTERNDL